MVPSPRVATYDKEPKMSAHEVAVKLSERISEGTFGFLMNNFAPPVCLHLRLPIFRENIN